MLKLFYNIFSKVGKQTFSGEKFMSEATKVVNYTDEMVESIVAEYEAAPSRETVDALAARFGKTSRSVIAKLSTLGIYQAPARVTKTGKPVVKKEALVAEIVARRLQKSPLRIDSESGNLRSTTPSKFFVVCVSAMSSITV